MELKIVDQDIIFLSYDEPNAEKNYSDLKRKFPWAKRVHGVKGSDAAHKACAALSETEHFVTVDADNIVDSTFMNVVIDTDALGVDESYVFSWCGLHHVTGLMYGNGGLKLWTREFVNNMRTHEQAETEDEKNNVEFCFDKKYYQFNDSFSTSYTNGSPFQAWRAGFREGVKMSLDEGKRVDDLQKLWWQNYQRLLIWCNIGRDVKHGVYSMLGAREAVYLTNCTDWDYVNVRDFEYLTDYWEQHHSLSKQDRALEQIREYGKILRSDLKLEIAEASADVSKFFRRVYINSPRIV
jgi:hypothetical protein